MNDKEMLESIEAYIQNAYQTIRYGQTLQTLIGLGMHKEHHDAKIAEVIENFTLGFIAPHEMYAQIIDIIQDMA